MEKYEDIINLPHHVSTRHPQMPMWSRAAQFAPFAALNAGAPTGPTPDPSPVREGSMEGSMEGEM